MPERRKCIISNCENLLAPHARLEECHQCRAVFRYWEKKTSSQIRDRQEALGKWQQRMQRLAHTPRGKRHVKVIREVIPTSRAAA